MKVALFTGELPTTVFIQRLVDGLAGCGIHLMLIGKKKRKIKSFSTDVKVISPREGLSLFLLFLRFSLFLKFKKSKQKRALDYHLIHSGLFSWKKRAFFYPVLYHQPDIFHIQWVKSIKDWNWVEDFGIKLVVSLRGAHINYSPLNSPELAQTYLASFPKVSRFHAVSNAIALESQIYGAPAERIDVVYSGLPLEQLVYQPKDILKSPLQIISVGRNHWKKGYVVALDAMNLLKQYEIPFHYTLVGVTPDEELLFQYHELELQDEVTFLSSIDFDAVVKMIQDADVLLLPSIEEGIANVVLEAMALGTLVITTDCGGMTEVVSQHKSGIVVPVLNPDAMAEALQFVSQITLEQYQAYTHEARKVIEEQHHETRMIQDMQSLYQKALQS